MLPGFHLIAAYGNPTTTVTDFGLTAVVDAAVSTRNGHWFFTTPFQLLAISLQGAACARGGLSSPTINAYTKMAIWPIMESFDLTSPVRFQSWVDAPFAFPQNEEIQVVTTTSGQDSIGEFCIAIISDPAWNRNIPRGISPEAVFTARFTCTVTGVTTGFSALVAITIDQSLRGGTYAVVGCEAQGDDLLAFRLVFNKPPWSNGVPLRPGSWASETLGDVPLQMYEHGSLYWGVWGKFATTEYPLFEAYCNSADSVAVEGRLYLVYLSDQVVVQY